MGYIASMLPNDISPATCAAINRISCIECHYTPVLMFRRFPDIRHASTNLVSIRRALAERTKSDSGFDACCILRIRVGKGNDTAQKHQCKDSHDFYVFFHSRSSFVVKDMSFQLIKPSGSPPFICFIIACLTNPVNISLCFYIYLFVN